MKIEITESRDLVIDHRSVNLGFPVEEARIKKGIVLVFLDPDSFYDQEQQKAGRRMGRFRNVLAVDGEGVVLWRAELPSSDPTDTYMQVESWNPFVLLSFSSFLCELDILTGRIVKTTFTK